MPTQNSIIVSLFWERVIKGNPCWEWNGYKSSKGYGILTRKSNPLCRGNRIKAHRLSYFIHYGPIPKGKWVLHACDNPPCVNPEHLYLGNHNANMVDMVIRKRQTKGSAINLSKLTEENIPIIRTMIRMGIKRKHVANKFSISISTINKIARGITWKHIP